MIKGENIEHAIVSMDEPDVGLGQYIDRALKESPEPKKLAKIKRSECAAIKMTTGNEKKFTFVIDGGDVLHWVGFGWVYHGPASEADYLQYPEVE